MLIVLIIIGAVSCSAAQELKPVEQSAPIIVEETIEETTEAVESTEEIIDYIAIQKATVEPTMYETLTANEILLLETVVQHEVGAFSKDYKTYVAEIIFNRIVSEDFPNTVYEVLFQDGQFQGIENWSVSGIVPDEETKQVVKEVFSKEYPSHDCTFYYNPALSEYDSIVWFEYSGDVEYVFSHTETDWGIEYTTRFFKIKGE